MGPDGVTPPQSIQSRCVKVLTQTDGRAQKLCTQQAMALSMASVAGWHILD